MAVSQGGHRKARWIEQKVEAGMARQTTHSGRAMGCGAELSVGCCLFCWFVGLFVVVVVVVVMVVAQWRWRGVGLQV